ncbi:M13 family metallopeptidase [Pseudoleptotrichia goodfellowii]|uniref:Endothelin-converting enzyme 1 n=1 Tax=Pseudoleptotrichia goodfellowii TaxID=157692 RepID=A0A510JE36_9FUSO|nr:M13 family metallopeptidase [Pseudoleptotrichia goodfellowii]BBM36681.1 endothelin-converting enzyme 1 [Pseudoleptotrichia goodfellowii]
MKKLSAVSLFLLCLGVNYGVEKQKNIKNIKSNVSEIQNKNSAVPEGDAELTKDLSKNIKPQEDFYKFVNENWEKRTKIPSTKPAWGSFTELAEKNQDFLKNLVSELKNKKLAENSDEKKIITLYNSYINMNRRNKEGIAPLKNDLERINAVKNIKDFEKYTIEVTKEGGGTLYEWGVGTDLNSSKDNAVYLGSAGLGLSRDYYQKETEENKEILKEYTKYVSDMLSNLGEKNTEEKARKIVEFEKRIAKVLLTNEEENDISKKNNPRKVDELSKIVKNVNLKNYLKESGVNTDKVIISQIKYYENLDKFLNDSNIEVIKDYLKFHLISSASGLLSDKLAQRRFEFYGKYMNGQKEREKLEKRALYFIDGTLGEMIGKVYVEKNFPPEAKQNAKEMVDYIFKAFRNRMENLTWMSEATKKKALEKLAKVTVKIGYPDKWRNFDEIVLNEKDSLYKQMEDISKWEYKEELKKVGKPVDKTEWFMSANTVNAYYSPSGNEIVFPAGILQFPFYDYKKSGTGSNFGGIGAVIGHEITHGFDVSGASFDGDGNVKDWWTKEDKKKFDSVTEKLANQFSEYAVAPNVYVNGKFTLTENIADLGGVNIAYDALQLYLKDHPEKNVKVDGYTQDELFFMNFARIWRQKATEEYLKNLVKSDPHSPNYFRVNGLLINIDAFHNTFKTKKGEKLYKEPKDRIKIW